MTSGPMMRRRKETAPSPLPVTPGAPVLSHVERGEVIALELRLARARRRGRQNARLRRLGIRPSAERAEVRRLVRAAATDEARTVVRPLTSRERARSEAVSPAVEPPSIRRYFGDVDIRIL